MSKNPWVHAFDALSVDLLARSAAHCAAKAAGCGGAETVRNSSGYVATICSGVSAGGMSGGLGVFACGLDQRHKLGDRIEARIQGGSLPYLHQGVERHTAALGKIV